VTEEPVIRRDGVGLADLWEELRRQVDERPMPVRVTARVRRSRLDQFRRLNAAHLTAEGPPVAEGQPAGATPAADDAQGAEADHAQGAEDADRAASGGEWAASGGEWAEVTLRFPAVQAARVLLSFGGDVVVTSPPEVCDDLRKTAAAVVAAYFS
jgi:hypothetical protein